MKNRYSLILEIIWIIIGIVCLAGGLKSIIIKDKTNIVVFILMAAIAFGFALFRHNQRKKR